MDMKAMKLLAVLGIAALPMVGCVQRPTPTVEYFRAHKEERVEQLARCTNDKARLNGEPACVNAREAERIESVGSLRDLPGVGLAPAKREEEEQAGEQQD